jgi:Gram-negative bacterial TonB protein C-terminal
MRSAGPWQHGPGSTPGVAGSATRQTRLLVVCALLSVLGHTAVLMNGQDSGHSGRDGPTATRVKGPLPERDAVVTVRLLDRPVAVSPVQTAPDPMRNAASITAADQTLSPPIATAHADIAVHPFVQQGSDGDGDGDDRYLTRGELDQPPAAQADIELPFPTVAPLGSYRAVLTLFIDPTGQVQRVRTEGAGLPPSLDDAARQAFMAVRFTPGIKGDQPVRSRIRVEVAYSTELLPRRSAAAEATGGPSAP